MPVGPLALNDEVALDLALKIVEAAKRDLGPAAIDAAQENLLKAMVADHGRLGRKNGKGFYDYPAQGPKTLWPGLAAFQQTKLDPDTIDVARTQTTVPRDPGGRSRAGDRGRCCDGPARGGRRLDHRLRLRALTGGTLSYIDGMGAAKFVTLCEKLRQKYGKRFAPPKIVVDMASEQELFYCASRGGSTALLELDCTVLRRGL